MTSVTLKDLEIRDNMLAEEHPELPICSFKNCGKKVDVTEGMGIDTSCPYHRLLHDHFLYEVDCNEHHPNFNRNVSRDEYRKMFREWTEKTGKEECDKIVVEMANEPINWKC